MTALLEILGKIGFDTHQFIMSTISFGIIYWIFHTKFLPTVVSNLSARQAEIDAGLAKSDEAAKELAAAQEKADAIVSEAKGDASEVMNQASEQSKALLDQAEQKAFADKQVVMEKAQSEIVSLRSEMERSVQSEAAELITAATKKVLGEEITPEIQEKITKNAQFQSAQ